MFKFLKDRKKKDNKGFTLVELVIVVAILAILVGILAPQYTKYVEKSRKAADVNRSPSSRQLKKYKFFLPVEIYLLAVLCSLQVNFVFFHWC